MAFMKKFLYFCLFLLPIFGFAKTHLFVLFDAGETYVLQPVIEDLKAQGEVVDVLALGTSQSLMPNAKTLLGVDRFWDRYQMLLETQLEDICATYEPEVVTIGVSSKIQLQIAQKFQKKASIVAYYDNFNPIERSVYAPLIREIEAHVDLFLTASEFGAASSHAKEVHVVGNPDLEKMISKINEVDRPTIKEKLGLHPTCPVVTYIGGYDTDYEEGLRLFATGMDFYPNYQIVICPHPKSDGSLEKSYFQKACFPEDTIAAIALADVVVCHRSTLGIKSLLAGKKVIFVDPVFSLTPKEWGAYSAGDTESFHFAMDQKESKVKGKIPDQSILLFRLLLTDTEREEESKD